MNMTDLEKIQQLTRALEMAKAERDEERRQHESTVQERDDAEQAISHAYFLVTGHSPEWSNQFGYDQAHEDIAGSVNLLKQSLAQANDRIAELEKALAAAISDRQLMKQSAERSADVNRRIVEGFRKRADAAEKEAHDAKLGADAMAQHVQELVKEIADLRERLEQNAKLCDSPEKVLIPSKSGELENAKGAE